MTAAGNSGAEDQTRSLWRATAAPAPDASPVAAGGRADAIVVGAGFTGLGAALRLAERGRAPVVLEAGDPGFGASGRTGGQVIPGLKYDPADLVRLFGDWRGEAMARFAGSAADATFDLIRRHGIDCAAAQCGWIQAAASAHACDLLHGRARQWADLAGTAVTLLDAAEVLRRTGAHGYRGGWVDPRGGMVQPLSYARGLARAAQSAGARVHGASAVTGLARTGDAWRVSVNGVELSSETVILATNAYTDDLWPGLKQSVVPATSVQIATEPLSPDLRDAVLPDGMPVSDSQRLLNYFRLDAAGRFVIGGRGAFSRARPQAERHFARLRRVALRRYPVLRGVEWTYRWAGSVALTQDKLPHLHRLAPGLFAALGLNGRGVAMSTQLGRLVADLACGADEDEIPMPVSGLRPIPLHALRRPGLEAIAIWYRILDRMGR